MRPLPTKACKVAQRPILTSTASSIACIPRGRRRESATSILQRLRAVPVHLFPAHVYEMQSWMATGTPGSTPGPEDRAELGAHTVCLLTTISPATSNTPFPAPTTHQCFAYEVAAAHVLRGGRVLYLCAPASRRFSVENFVLTVERQWVTLQLQHEKERDAKQGPNAQRPTTHEQNSSTDDKGDSETSTYGTAPAPTPSGRDDLLRSRQDAVLAAVQRLEVLPCSSMVDFYAVCRTYSFPETGIHTLQTPATTSTLPADHSRNRGSFGTAVSGAGAKAEPQAATPTSRCAIPSTRSTHFRKFSSVASSEPPPAIVRGAGGRCNAEIDIVPLCIVEGLTGPFSATSLLERAAGVTIPVPHYLLCLLQRRLRCALMLIEEPASAMKYGEGGAEDGVSFMHPPGGGHLTEYVRDHPSDVCQLPNANAVLAAADLVHRLRIPHNHAMAGVLDGPSTCSSTTVTCEQCMLTQQEAQRLSGKKTSRCDREDAGAHLANTSPSPVSLRNIQFCAVCLEWAGDRRPLHPRSEHSIAPIDVNEAQTATLSFASPPLLLPDCIEWRYRVHFMHTTLTDYAVGKGGVEGNGLSAHRWDSSRGDAPWLPIRNTHRPPETTRASNEYRGLHYKGTWVQSSQWQRLQVG